MGTRGFNGAGGEKDGPPNSPSAPKPAPALQTPGQPRWLPAVPAEEAGHNPTQPPGGYYTGRGRRRFPRQVLPGQNDVRLFLLTHSRREANARNHPKPAGTEGVRTCQGLLWVLICGKNKLFGCFSSLVGFLPGTLTIGQSLNISALLNITHQVEIFYDTRLPPAAEASDLSDCLLFHPPVNTSTLKLSRDKKKKKIKLNRCF